MAFFEKQLCISLPAAADYSDNVNLYKLVNVNSSGQAVIVSSAGGDAIGAIQTNAAAGNPMEIQFGGIAKVRLGGTVAAGAKIQADASGDAITAASGDLVVGVAIQGGADGEIGSVLLVSKHILA